MNDLSFDMRDVICFIGHCGDTVPGKPSPGFLSMTGRKVTRIDGNESYQVPGPS